MGKRGWKGLCLNQPLPRCAYIGGSPNLISEHFSLCLSLLRWPLFFLVICSWQHTTCLLNVCLSGQGLACGSHWCVYSCGNIWHVMFCQDWKTKKNEKGNGKKVCSSWDRKGWWWVRNTVRCASAVCQPLSLSGSKRSIVCSFHRLLSGWTSGTNLNINSHIQEVSKRRNQERELWDWNPKVIPG